MDDLISRQMAIETLQSERQGLVEFMDFCLKTEMYATRYETKLERNRIEADIFILENLPTAEKKGKWLPNPDDTTGYCYFVCSVCGSYVYDPSYYYYCPNCGARMEESDDRENQTNS